MSMCSQEATEAIVLGSLIDFGFRGYQRYSLEKCLLYFMTSEMDRF